MSLRHMRITGPHTNILNIQTALSPVQLCFPPPTITNAVSESQGNNSVGAKVLYACEEGFYKIGGDTHLR